MSVRAVRWPQMRAFGPLTMSPGLPVAGLVATPAGTAVVGQDGSLRVADLGTGEGIVSGSGEAPGWVPLPRGVATESVTVDGSSRYPVQVIGIGRGNTLRTIRWRGPAPVDDRVRVPEVVTDLVDGELLDVLGPTGNDTWAVRARTPDGQRRAGTQDVVVWDVDLREMRARTVIDGPGLDVASESAEVGQEPSYASDLWSVPTATRPAPEDPTSPRLLVGLGAGVALGLGAVAWSLRRRGRTRG